MRLGTCKLQQSPHLLSYIPSTSLPVFPPLPNLFPPSVSLPPRKKGRAAVVLQEVVSPGENSACS